MHITIKENNPRVLMITVGCKRAEPLCPLAPSIVPKNTRTAPTHSFASPLWTRKSGDAHPSTLQKSFFHNASKTLPFILSHILELTRNTPTNTLETKLEPNQLRASAQALPPVICPRRQYSSRGQYGNKGAYNTLASRHTTFGKLPQLETLIIADNLVMGWLPTRRRSTQLLQQIPASLKRHSR